MQAYCFIKVNLINFSKIFCKLIINKFKLLLSGIFVVLIVSFSSSTVLFMLLYHFKEGYLYYIREIRKRRKIAPSVTKVLIDKTAMAEEEKAASRAVSRESDTAEEKPFAAA